MTASPTQVVLLYKRVFYAMLLLWSSLLVAFTIILLVYTTQPRHGRSRFGPIAFYDPSVVELCICGLLTILFCFLMLFVLAARTHRSTISRNWFELSCVALLWILWLGGTAASSARWWFLDICTGLFPCRILQAMLAFAWVGWIFLTVQLGIIVPILSRTGDWDGHIFERPEKPVIVEEGSSYKEQRAGSEFDATPWSHRERRSQRSESYTFSSFSAVVPHWLAWSDGRSSMRSSTTPTTPASRRQSGQTRRKSSLATHFTFTRANNQPLASSV